MAFPRLLVGPSPLGACVRTSSPLPDDEVHTVPAPEPKLQTEPRVAVDRPSKT